MITNESRQSCNHTFNTKLTSRTKYNKTEYNIRQFNPCKLGLLESMKRHENNNSNHHCYFTDSCVVWHVTQTTYAT